MPGRKGLDMQDPKLTQGALLTHKADPFNGVNRYLESLGTGWNNANAARKATAAKPSSGQLQGVGEFAKTFGQSNPEVMAGAGGALLGGLLGGENRGRWAVGGGLLSFLVAMMWKHRQSLAGKATGLLGTAANKIAEDPGTQKAIKNVGNNLGSGAAEGAVNRVRTEVEDTKNNWIDSLSKWRQMLPGRSIGFGPATKQGMGRQQRENAWRRSMEYKPRVPAAPKPPTAPGA